MARTPKHELRFCTKKQLFDILELLWKKLEKQYTYGGGGKSTQENRVLFCEAKTNRTNY